MLERDTWQPPDALKPDTPGALPDKLQVLIRRGYSHYRRGDTDTVLREGMKQVPGENLEGSAVLSRQ